MALRMDFDIKLIYTNDKIKYDDYFSNMFPELEMTIPKTVTVNNAYLMINKIEGNKEIMDMSLNVYKDETKDYLISTQSYSFVPSINDGSDNFIKQGYSFLKTLPEFQDAVDVLEEGQMA